MSRWRRSLKTPDFSSGVSATDRWAQVNLRLERRIEELTFDLERLEHGDIDVLRLTSPQPIGRMTQIAQSWNSTFMPVAVPIQLSVTPGEALSTRIREVEQLLGSARAEHAQHLTQQPGDDIIGS